MQSEPSLVLELQQAAADAHVRVSVVARKALMVASKLGLPDIKEWLKNELDGYGPGDAPEYRKTVCELKTYNPYHGMQPVVMADSELAEVLSTDLNKSSVGEIESLLANKEAHQFMSPFPAEMEGELAKVFGRQVKAYRFSTAGQLTSILETVRNRILEWALRLESEGILGKGMSFSEDDKAKAQATPAGIIIGNVQGVVGNVTGGTISFGDFKTIADQLQRAGVRPEEISELEGSLKELTSAASHKRLTLTAKIGAWLERHQDLSGALVQAISQVTAAAISRPN